MHWEFLNHMENVFNFLQSLEQEKKDRDYPMTWERVHAVSCAQLGRMLARKRGVDTEMAALACSIHDIGRWVTGRQNDHARNGEEPARRFLENYPLSATEKEEIIKATVHHSEKDKIGTPLEEIVKDADILDCYFHGEEIVKPHHAARLKKLVEELGL